MGLYVNNIAHRDLKPENLLLKTKNGKLVLKIADFGISGHHNKENMTEGKGSEGYWSPQQAEGKDYTKKCDVFAFGAIATTLVTNELPSDSECVDFWSKKSDEK